MSEEPLSPQYESFGGLSPPPLPVLLDDDRGPARPSSPRRLWMPDALSGSCSQCDESFGLLRRRHHCRVCGKVFCHACSAYYIDGSLVGAEGSVRSCRRCSLHLQERLEEERSMVLRALASENARVVNGYGPPVSMPEDSVSPEVSDAERRKRIEEK